MPGTHARYSKAIAATATTATAARLDPLAVAELDIGAKVGELVGELVGAYVYPTMVGACVVPGHSICGVL